MFESINRDALILFPKQPLFDWVNSIFKDQKIECPEPLAHDEGNIYLLPEMDHYSYTVEFLKENFEVFFEKELFEWCTDENDWPKKLTWEMFEEWFHYSIQSMVEDTLEEEIIKDEF